MPSKSITLTAVQLDLVNSTEYIKDIYERLDLDNEGLRIFIDKIAKVVSEAFDKSVNSFNNEPILTRNDSNQAAINNAIPNFSEKPNFNRIADAMADGYRLTFESVECAYLFVQDFCRLVEERNKKPGIGKWVFRIGAATGNINCDNLNINRMVAYTLLEVKELEAGAYPRWFFVDQATYDTFSEEIKRNFSQINFKNKGGKDKQAWGCEMIADAPVSQPLPTPSVTLPREALSNPRSEFYKKRMAAKQQELAAVEFQLARTLSAVDEVRLNKQAEDILKELEELEAKFNQL